MVDFDLEPEIEPKVKSRYPERKYAKDKIDSFSEDSNRNTKLTKHAVLRIRSSGRTYKCSLDELSQDRNGRSVLGYYEE